MLLYVIFTMRRLSVCVSLSSVSCHVCSVVTAISESPEIRQILVDLQSGMDPDELETSMIKSDDESATCNRKTRRLD